MQTKTLEKINERTRAKEGDSEVEQEHLFENPRKWQQRDPNNYKN